MFLINIPRPKTTSLWFPISERRKKNIKEFLEKHSSVGNYSMEDVLAELDDRESNPLAGLDNEEDFLKSYENLNKFDTVVDYSDHLYYAPDNEFCYYLLSLLYAYMFQPPIDWVNKIHEECKILTEHLPETIFVRAYEDREDLLRAVIIGPEGTPFHNVLFFFVVCFPMQYPDSPPLQIVCSHSFVLGVHPNMNKCGEEQLFRTYTTATLEKTWVPGTSNLLQYLLSIQGLILTTMPLFNEIPVLGDSLITFLTIQREYPDKITRNDGVYHGRTTQVKSRPAQLSSRKMLLHASSSLQRHLTKSDKRKLKVIVGVGINVAVKQKRKCCKRGRSQGIEHCEVGTLIKLRKHAATLDMDILEVKIV
ncbi:ubiquitin-conjugating enzyme/RWD-like protein [Tanacetum coccineum]